MFQLSDKVQQGIRIRGSNNRQKVILVHPVQGGGPGGKGVRVREDDWRDSLDRQNHDPPLVSRYSTFLDKQNCFSDK